MAAMPSFEEARQRSADIRAALATAAGNGDLSAVASAYVAFCSAIAGPGPTFAVALTAVQAACPAIANG